MLRLPAAPAPRVPYRRASPRSTTGGCPGTRGTPTPRHTRPQLRRRGCAASSQRAHEFLRLHDLVVGVAELVAARGEVAVTHLVDGDLDGRAADGSDDFAVLEVVRSRVALGARLRRISGQCGQGHLPADPAELELANARQVLLRHVARF